MGNRIRVSVLLASLLALRGAAFAQTQEGETKTDVQAELQRLREELQKYSAEVKQLQETVAKSTAKSDDVTTQGRVIYRSTCEACHGRLGDGKGPGSRPLNPQPRDFTTGNYKWRSTPTGSLPLDSDLFRTVSEGVPGTAMPSWKKLLTREERYAVVQYVKLFSPRFKDEPIDEPIAIADPPPRTPERLALGRTAYEKNKCGDCHGTLGKGDGPSAPTLKDDKGVKIEAFDFTSGVFRGGSSDADVYRTFTTGVAGTPMPQYEDPLTEEQRWALVQYVKSLLEDRGWFGYVFRKPTDPW
ncbi:MAG: c-type cytochrome [Planctomycetes bacterium]|nr:c-type cytochrome [Planctomycetota bacterium]MBI3848378.1 c-type cytochrome [Planctomycetota bacterium]